MARYWVLFVKYAGIEVEANSEDEAIEIASETDEEMLESNQVTTNSWLIDSANLIDN